MLCPGAVFMREGGRLGDWGFIMLRRVGEDAAVQAVVPEGFGGM